MPKKTKLVAPIAARVALEEMVQRLVRELVNLRAGKTTKEHCLAVVKEADELQAEVDKLIKKEQERSKKPKKIGRTHRAGPDVH